MKKIAVLALVMAVAFSCSVVHAATEDVLEGMGKKLFRGVANVFTGWIELPAQTIKGFKGSDNKWAGTGVGILKGIGHSIGRTAWGVVEVAGFWTANPEDNEGMGIPLDAEYAWEEGEQYDCMDPDFYEAGLKPMGRKFLRGLGNGLFGVAELPGQIAKGMGEGSWDLGIIKGFWFWYSREVYGIADMATAIFPTPSDNPGYMFNREYPWDALVDAIEE